MKVANFLKKALPYCYLILFLLSTILIIVKALESAETASVQSGNLANYLQNNFKPIEDFAKKTEDFNTLVTKFIGHYGLFAVNGFFAILTFNSFIFKPIKPLLFTLIFSVIISCASEIMQLIAVDRNPTFTDVILNIQGYVSGVSVALILISLVSLTTLNNVENFKNYLVKSLIFLSYVSLTIIFYIAFSNKVESVNFCTKFEVFVTTIWFVYNAIILCIKGKKLKLT